MADVDDIRERLETELQELLSRHARISAHLRNEDREMPADWSDMAQFVENDEVLEALEHRTRQRVEGIAGAIQRIEEGTYATCAECGSDIAEERLDLLPTTRVCAACA